MSVRIRLTRVGSKKNPIWRVVVADQRSPRDGRSIETIGRYNAQTDPSTIVLDTDRVEHWIARGAVPTNTVRSLIKAHAKGTPPAAEQAVAAADETEAPAEEAVAEAAEPPAEGDAAPAGEAAPDADAAPSEESAG
jgi:small subunit ribosomal protein S16